MTYERYEIEATKEDFVKAFSDDFLLSELELRQLKLHFSQPGYEATPTFLGQMMREETHHGASRRNVAMAKKISNFLRVDPPVRKDGTCR